VDTRKHIPEFLILHSLRYLDTARREERFDADLELLSIVVIYIDFQNCETSTYGHSQLKTGHPVRSAIHKQLNGRLVLRWVTTWESLLLYVLHLFLLPVPSLISITYQAFAPVSIVSSLSPSKSRMEAMNVAAGRVLL
jgi:hypothetical protein